MQVMYRCSLKRNPNMDYIFPLFQHTVYKEGLEREKHKVWHAKKLQRGWEDCWRNVIKSVYGVLSLPHWSRTTCSLEVITLGSRDILHVNSESLHLKLGVKIPFPPIYKLNHLQDDKLWRSKESTVIVSLLLCQVGAFLKLKRMVS